MVLLFVWILFFYFLWRYWLYARPLHAQITHRFDEMRNSDRALARAVRRMFDTYEGYPVGDALFQPGVDAATIICLPHDITYKSAGLFTVKVTTSFHTLLENGNTQAIQAGLPLSKDIPLTLLVRHFSRCYFRAAAGRTTFSDLMAPYILAAITLVACSGHALTDWLVTYGH